MKKYILLLLFPYFLFSQVGIGTTNPKGQLDITSNNLGVVVPRVTSIESVTDGNGNPAVDGTIVYDLSRKKMCYRLAGSWICMGKNITGTTEIGVVNPVFQSISNYIKASNTNSHDLFGYSVSLSSDGSRLAVGAYSEDSNATGINGNQADNSVNSAGAVYVFNRIGTTWSQEAYIKASNTNNGDLFGLSVSFSADGSRLAVGAYNEDSNATGINGSQTNNSVNNAGAVYVFNRIGTTWSQEAYIKASNTNGGDLFGSSVSFSADGNRLAVGATGEASNVTGIGGNQLDNSANDAGAVYVFIRIGSIWTQEAYIKASNTNGGDLFGYFISFSADGNRLAVGVFREDSNATGINGNQADNSTNASGAVYVFNRIGTTWSQEAYIKASNTNSGDLFGLSVSFSADGNRLAVGAIGEASNVTGIGGNQLDNSANYAGAVYVFNRTGTTWSQEAYIKASNTNSNNYFGGSVSLSADGSRLAVGASGEASNATGINGNQLDNSTSGAGAVYVFNRIGTTWNQETYVKASNTNSNDYFGGYVSLSTDGSRLAIGASGEDSNATGIGGNQLDNSASNAGAVYIIE